MLERYKNEKKWKQELDEKPTSWTWEHFMMTNFSHKQIIFFFFQYLKKKKKHF